MRRKVTFFEKALFIVGIACTLLGFFLINKLYVAEGQVLSFSMLTVVFLWFLLIFQIVIAATSENQKEEMFIITKELHEETKLMRQVVKDNLLEIKLMRDDLGALRKIDRDLTKRKK